MKRATAIGEAFKLSKKNGPLIPEFYSQTNPTFDIKKLLEKWGFVKYNQLGTDERSAMYYKHSYGSLAFYQLCNHHGNRYIFLAS